MLNKTTSGWQLHFKYGLMSNFITFRPTQIACINNKLNDKLELQKKKNL